MCASSLSQADERRSSADDDSATDTAKPLQARARGVFNTFTSIQQLNSEKTCAPTLR